MRFGRDFNPPNLQMRILKQIEMCNFSTSSVHNYWLECLLYCVLSESLAEHKMCLL